MLGEIDRELLCELLVTLGVLLTVGELVGVVKAVCGVTVCVDGTDDVEAVRGVTESGDTWKVTLTDCACDVGVCVEDGFRVEFMCTAELQLLGIKGVELT